MWNIQHIIFIWRRRYSQIFKFALVYLEAAIVHKIFETNSSFHVKKGTTQQNLKEGKILSHIKKSQNIMNMIVSPHQAKNNNFWQYLNIIFRRHLSITLKIFVRFILKELRRELSSSFDTISNFEEEGTLFLQKAVVFEMK